MLHNKPWKNWTSWILKLCFIQHTRQITRQQIIIFFSHWIISCLENYWRKRQSKTGVTGVPRLLYIELLSNWNSETCFPLWEMYLIKRKLFWLNKVVYIFKNCLLFITQKRSLISEQPNISNESYIFLNNAGFNCVTMENWWYSLSKMLNIFPFR